jgi:hypothetical protein
LSLICKKFAKGVLIPERASGYIWDVVGTQSQFTQKLKAPIALFAVLLLLAVEVLVASETLHHAVCGDEHHDSQPCAVKLFAQGMVDLGPAEVGLPPREWISLLTILPQETPVVCRLAELPPGRAPPVMVS